jgi:hypothetical protein
LNGETDYPKKRKTSVVDVFQRNSEMDGLPFKWIWMLVFLRTAGFTGFYIGSLVLVGFPSAWEDKEKGFAHPFQVFDY